MSAVDTAAFSFGGYFLYSRYREFLVWSVNSVSFVLQDPCLWMKSSFTFICNANMSA
jgi:hypothetical protein